MEQKQTNIPFKRRSFFIRVLGGIAGGWLIGNLFSGFRRSIADMKNHDAVQVSINPLAIPRATKETVSHGK
jgi:hypothetical protein